MGQSNTEKESNDSNELESLPKSFVEDSLRYFNS
jgi:hypothetical protein